MCDQFFCYPCHSSLSACTRNRTILIERRSQVGAATALALDRQGNILVADSTHHCIQVPPRACLLSFLLTFKLFDIEPQQFSATGEFMRWWGFRGGGDRQFQSPMGQCACPCSSAFVVDGVRWCGSAVVRCVCRSGH